MKELQCFSSSGCLRLSRGGSSCSSHTKPNTRPHLSPGAPPVCPPCQDKDPSQPGQETDPPPLRPRHTSSDGEKVAAGSSPPTSLSKLPLCAFPWGGGALILLLSVSLQKHNPPPPCCTINPTEKAQQGKILQPEPGGECSACKSSLV